MDYKTILIVVVLLGLPTIVLVIAKIISMIRQGRNSVESESDVYELDREAGEIEFGRGESGKRPSTSNDEIQDSYEHGAGGSQSVDAGLTTMEVFEYLEEAVICRDPAGKESFEELPEQDDSSDDSVELKKSD